MPGRSHAPIAFPVVAPVVPDLSSLTEWLSRVSFARPAVLWLLLLLPVVALVAWLSGRARRRALGRFGGLALPSEPALPRRGRRLARPLFTVGLALLVLGSAGPRWGLTEEAGSAVGRDLVVVLDLSRSMLAPDMEPDADGAVTRWEVARNALRGLADEVQRRGGHRLALVVFAAKPVVLSPLTTDYDHFRAKLAEIDARFPPPEAGPQDDPVPSGTRIGAAVERAVQAHDPRFPGYQDVLMISDGDDPLGDEEWRRAVGAARRAEVPVHTAGVGDPDEAATVPLGPDELLEFGGVPVRTRLVEEPLREIARQTRGLYLPARRRPPDLAGFFRTRIEPRPSRELPDDALPRPRDRSAWFLGPALVFLVMSWWLEDRAPAGRKKRTNHDPSPSGAPSGGAAAARRRPAGAAG